MKPRVEDVPEFLGGMCCEALSELRTPVSLIAHLAAVTSTTFSAMRPSPGHLPRSRAGR